MAERFLRLVLLPRALIEAGFVDPPTAKKLRILAANAKIEAEMIGGVWFFEPRHVRAIGRALKLQTGKTLETAA